MKILQLKYGNTNTYFIGDLLIDTDMAGTMTSFRKELKKCGIVQSDIRYIMATHYHPDHMGLIGELMKNGAKLLLCEHQMDYVHSSDVILARDKRFGFIPIDESKAIVIKCEESRAFLSALGINGEIIPTKSHSPDGAALVLDDGNAYVGDLEPYAFLGGYTENESLREDWEKLFGMGVKTVHYGHMNDQNI